VVDVRAEAIDEGALRRTIASLHVSRPHTWRSAGRLATMWAVYAGCAVAAVQVGLWPVQAVLWFVMSWVLLGNGAVGHETVHGHLFGPRWANRVVGTVAGMSIGAPWSVYRCYHLGHHQHSCTTDDPEGEPYLFTSKWNYLLVPLGGPLFAGQFGVWTLRTMVGRPPAFVRSARQRRDVVVDGLLGLAFYGAMVAVGLHSFELLLHAWLGPWLIAVVVLEPLVLIPEHYGARVADARFALRTTRTVRSSRLVTWLYWQNNLHTAHHLAPGVVPQELGKVDAEFVQPNLAAEWTSSGYLAFHWSLWRALPWRGGGTDSRAAAANG